jgi:DHA1 family multidrug resistance protein-like MFS transporter
MSALQALKNLIRDAPAGQLLRFATNNRVLAYPEERPDFECPRAYDNAEKPNVPAAPERSPALEKIPTAASSTSTDSSSPPKPAHLTPTRSLPWSPTRLEADVTLARTHSLAAPIAPTTTADGVVLADWYSTTDGANPQNCKLPTSPLYILA